MEQKKCSKCTKNKSIDEFYKCTKNKSGLRSWCKECGLKDNRLRESKYNETRRKYRFEHQEEYREKKRNYYENNKKNILSNNANWRQTFNGKLSSYKQSALKRNIEWLLSDDEFKIFWSKDCFYCGDKIETIGIDRKDNNDPYILKNCVPCCSTCNIMKMSLSEDEFINKIRKIINFYDDK